MSEPVRHQNKVRSPLAPACGENRGWTSCPAAIGDRLMHRVRRREDDSTAAGVRVSAPIESDRSTPCPAEAASGRAAIKLKSGGWTPCPAGTSLDARPGLLPRSELSPPVAPGDRRTVAKTPYPRCQRAADAGLAARRIRAATEEGTRQETLWEHSSKCKEVVKPRPAKPLPGPTG